DESLPDAIHGSAALEFTDDSPSTTPNARIVEELISYFDQSQSSSLPKVVVANGFESNLAQMCAKKLGDYTCATYFVSKSLRTDDQTKLFPTIAYQLATHFIPYAALLEAKLRRDPSLFRMSLKVQFKKLIVEPFLQVSVENKIDLGSCGHTVIIIDGLDEYAI